MGITRFIRGFWQKTIYIISLPGFSTKLAACIITFGWAVTIFIRNEFATNWSPIHSLIDSLGSNFAAIFLGFVGLFPLGATCCRLLARGGPRHKMLYVYGAISIANLTGWVVWFSFLAESLYFGVGLSRPACWVSIACVYLFTMAQWQLIVEVQQKHEYR